MKLISQFKSIRLSFHSVTLLLAAYYALVLNLPLYKDLKHIFSGMSAVDTGFIISIPFAFFFAFICLFSLFSWPKITKVFFSVLLISSAVVCYATYNYGAIFDVDMIRNLVGTNPGEASSYLSIASVLWVTGLGIFPAILLVMVPLKSESVLPFVLKKGGLMILAAAGLVVIGSFWFQDYVSVGRNNSYLRKILIPTYYVHSVDKFVRQTYFSKPMPFTHIGTDATQKPGSAKKPSLVVLIVGETARSQNYQSNGYARPTNPYTRQQDVISFQDVHSCGTATAVSLPCMFSRLDRRDYDQQRAYHQDNLLDVIQRAGVDVLWRENDGAPKGVPDHVKYQNLERSPKHPMCDHQSCLDMALLDGFSENVHDLSGNKLVVLHLIGSHGPTYYRRYPEKFNFFTPDCPRADIENCTHEQLVNSYDNTIRYTDYVVSQTINQLKKLEKQYDTALVYLSDHGESLGESGLYLHGMPYSLAPDYQKKVPLMMWLSDDFKADKQIDETCLKSEAKQGHFSHDNLFDSMLGMLDISTRLYRKPMDIFAACRHS
ncbi:Phosphoethanolamine transferase EptA [Vibrio aerogenes CECT 7868]|uniref:Phosphoethanolamine transferase EptA n=1 Tax=Vibrio aerogenes CECT 7868 TaxID=1216006 RepID=A0A1M5ZNI4_9VIBR|nr:phosphoethanolamine--lipid A transferase [Vibrio aerogenes]SHI25761.1 Phosphoethanolamine transferase EptA [Vibrio aerogenes CECT 7868]